MNLYQKVFGTQEGDAMLAELQRIVNMTKLSRDDPCSSAAIWKTAQMSLLQHIHNKMDKEQNENNNNN
jgi:hypothetical protein